MTTYAGQFAVRDYYYALLHGRSAGLASNGVCMSAASAAGRSARYPSNHCASAKEVVQEWQVDMPKQRLQRRTGYK